MSKKMQTLKNILSEEIKERVNNVAKKFLPSIRPIYGVDVKSEPVHIGSCVLFKVDTHHFLITAAHVIDCNQCTTLYIGGQKHLVPIKGQYHVTSPSGGNRNNDKFDIAFMDIDAETLSEIGNVRFLLPNEIDPNDIAKRGHVYLALGYPNSKNKKLDRYKKKVKLKPFIFSSTSVNSSVYTALGISDHSHLLIDFKKNKIKNDMGKRMISPDPFGISGGGLWRLHEFTQINSIVSKERNEKLVGILIEWHRTKGIIMAIRVSCVVEALKHKYPHISNLLPHAHRVRVSIKS